MMGEKQKKKWSEIVLEEQDKGNVVFLCVDSVIVAPIKEIVKQPTDGLLWDLNRDRVTALTFMDQEGMIHWVNNFAVALVIRELKSQVAQLKAELDGYKAGAEIENTLIALLEDRAVQLEADLVGFEKDNADLHGENEMLRRLLGPALVTVIKVNELAEKLNLIPHSHVFNEINDSCAKCGLSLTHSIHSL